MPQIPFFLYIMNDLHPLIFLNPLYLNCVIQHNPKYHLNIIIQMEIILLNLYFMIP